MKREKKLIRILFLVSILLLNFMFNTCIIQNISFAATTGTYQGMTYKIDETNQEVTITDFDDSVTTLTIPETIEGYPVTSIGMCAFEYSELTSVKIPKTVKYMGNRAFSTGNLLEVEFLDGVTTIGKNAFQACANLKKVIIPNSVTTIDSTAFSFCYNLTYVEIPKSVTVMYSAFNQSGLVEAVLEDGIETIPPHAFEECKSLTTIKIPDSVTSIGEFAFSGCESLISLEIPSSVTKIETNAFYNFKNTLYVYEGSYAEKWAEENGVNYKTYPLKMSECTINKINDKTYTGSEITPKVIVKDGEMKLVEDIDYTVSYSNNINLGTATITVTGKGNYTGTNTIQFNIVEETVEPETITGKNNNFEYEVVVETEEATITDCIANGTNMVIPEEIDGYKVVGIGYGAFADILTLESIEIPDSVVNMGMRVFSNCSSLESVTFGNGITTIDAYTFDNCVSLETIEIPDNITSIGLSAFSDCTNLKSVTLGNNVKEINTWAFRNCTSLTTLYIPESVSTIGLEAFQGCNGLTLIEVDENNSEYDSRENCNAIIRTSNNELILGCINTVIPESTKSIGISAFYNCTSLTSIQIPDSVNNIENSAFYGCSSLSSIEIPDGVTNIGHSAFYDCRQLASIKMPSNLTSIGANLFYNCVSLSSIEIPEGVEYIGNYAFYNCLELTSINLPDTVKKIGSYAFYNCLKLENIKLPNNLTSIEDHAFLGCETLTYIAIPNKVTKIGNNAFRVCNNLKSITIPESVVEIGEDAFAYTHKDLILTVVYGSYAEKYADENNLSYTLIGKTMQEFTNNVDSNTKISLKGVADIGVELETGIINETDDTFIEITDTITDFDNYTVLGAYEISLVGGEYEGELTITFELGAENEGKTVRIWHKTSTGEIETYERIVADGVVSITVTELSPFLLAYTDDTEYKLGDVNGDGNITLADYAKILAHVKETKLLTEDEKKAADVNGDGNVTLADYAKVLAHVKETALLP